RDDGEGRPGGVSRALFWTTAVIAVGAGGGALYTNMEKSDLEKKVPPGGCAQAEFKGDCDRGETLANATTALLGVSAVTTVAAAFFFYKGYVGTSGRAGVDTVAGRKHQG